MTFLSKDQLEQSPPLSQRGRAGIDILGSIQDYSSGPIRKIAKAEFEQTPDAQELAAAPEDLESDKARVVRARRVAHALPAFRFERFLQRYVAEEVYMRGIPAVEERREEFEGLRLDSETPIGKLELDPTLSEPKYFTGVDWHLEPGGYDGYDLYGDLFTHVLGPRVFKYGGYAAVGHREDITSHRVDVLQQLRKDNYTRIYEAGCGGFSTLAAAHKVYPEAELVGSDLSALLLSNGHRLAERLGIPVVFKQRDARTTGEPDASFDAAILYAVLHEMPPSAGKEVLAEMYRILQPGGEIVISDPPPFRAVDPFQAVVLDWDTKHRGEPFFTAVGHTNWAEVLQAVGFVDVDEHALGPGHYPWVTLGTKPL